MYTFNGIASFILTILFGKKKDRIVNLFTGRVWFHFTLFFFLRFYCPFYWFSLLNLFCVKLFSVFLLMATWKLCGIRICLCLFLYFTLSFSVCLCLCLFLLSFSVFICLYFCHSVSDMSPSALMMMFLSFMSSFSEIYRENLTHLRTE